MLKTKYVIRLLAIVIAVLAGLATAPILVSTINEFYPSAKSWSGWIGAAILYLTIELGLVFYGKYSKIHG